ncbi:restriction endonuclease subunit S [Ensifer sp. MPMI2T]|nr:restriction endonuclease subunit S [Ensifer sp. MPMI2T]
MSFTQHSRYKSSNVDGLEEVPEHWRLSRLGFASWVRARLGWKGLKADEYVDDGYVFLATPNIKGREIDFENVNYIDQIRYDESPEIALGLGDVLLAKDGSTLGTVNVVRCLPRPATVNSSIAVITPRADLSGMYLFYLFQSSYMQATIQRIKGGMGVPHLFQEDLNKFHIPLPPLPEQIAIASFLDRETGKIDALVEEQKRLIELLKEKRQAVISQAVTKGLNSESPMKVTRIDWLQQVPRHWSLSRLGFATWVRARLGWKGLKADEYVNEGYVFLATPNIKGREIDFDNVNYIDQSRYEESPEIALQVGDVLLAKDGSTLGTVNVVRCLPRPATVNSSIAVITPGDGLSGVYLFYLFQSSYMQATIQRIKGGMGVPHLFQEDLNKFHIPLPPLPEQVAIADFLDRETEKLDLLAAQVETAIAKLQERRAALISAAVNGKIDVRNLVGAREAAE